MNEHNEDKLKSNIKQALDDSTDALDASTLSKIRLVRARAVEKVGNKSFNWFGVLSGALATACVMVFAIMILLKSPTPVQSVPVDDIEMISSSDNLEMFEDLEFYLWLEEHELTG